MRRACVIASLLGCGVQHDDAAGTSTSGVAMECPGAPMGPASSATAAESVGTSDDTTSGQIADLPSCVYDLAYGPCEKACNQAGVYCPSFSGAAGSWSVCAIDCESVDTCPPAPDGAPVVCHLGSCFLDCASAECPPGTECVDFAGDDVHRVCMVRG